MTYFTTPAGYRIVESTIDFMCQISKPNNLISKSNFVCVLAVLLVKNIHYKIVTENENYITKVYK